MPISKYLIWFIISCILIFDVTGVCVCVEEQVYGLEKLHSALLHRPKGKPLLTVRALPSCGIWIWIFARVCGFNYLTWDWFWLFIFRSAIMLLPWMILLLLLRCFLRVFFWTLGISDGRFAQLIGVLKTPWLLHSFDQSRSCQFLGVTGFIRRYESNRQ